MVVRPSPNAPVVAVLLALLGLAMLVKAEADSGQAIEPAAKIREVAEQYVAAQVAPTASVQAQPLDGRLRLPACPQPLEPSSSNPATRGGWNILVTCRDRDTAIWSIFVPVRVADLRPVVVATRSVPPGQPITADMLKLEPRDLATLPSGHIAGLDSVIGQTLRRPLGPGAALTPDALAVHKMIKRGALVTLVGRSGTLEVRTQGKALADGGGGERIAVENLSSKRVVQGTVRDGDTVDVGL
jgi:flagella basal body P-ring formation protein FlgA